MIQITPQMRILVAVEPVDFRKGIDGLAALCRQVLASDPLGGALFVFCSQRGQHRPSEYSSTKLPRLANLVPSVATSRASAGAPFYHPTSL